MAISENKRNEKYTYHCYNKWETLFVTASGNAEKYDRKREREKERDDNINVAFLVKYIKNKLLLKNTYCPFY